MASVVIGTEASNSHITVISVIDYIAKQIPITVTLIFTASLVPGECNRRMKKQAVFR